jgi:zinc transporter 9
MNLVMLSAIMATSSFVAGMLPISISLSPRQLRAVTALGSGLLIGTALIIIIPEGIQTLYQSPSNSHPNPTSSKDHQSKNDNNDNDGDPHTTVALALIAGFLLMYLIDVLPPLRSSAHHHHHHQSIPLTSSDSDHDLLDPPSKPAAAASHAHATTIGLVIHSFADGIALGASSATPASSLGFVVFLAILVHKAPAAFGLTTALLKGGAGKRTARAHLALFSVAAPVGAVVTWAALRAVGGVESSFGTGVALMFSGGTFL